jgi:hypothetical protein
MWVRCTESRVVCSSVAATVADRGHVQAPQADRQGRQQAGSGPGSPLSTGWQHWLPLTSPNPCSSTDLTARCVSCCGAEGNTAEGLMQRVCVVGLLKGAIG